jgi:nitric oxide dioxygenase
VGEVTLHPATIRTVKATAPILRERGVEITRRMYERLFRNEEIKNLFNQSHHGEEGTQPRALAGAVHAYADHIDHLEELGPMVERIAQKHVALNIAPEHYPYVGEALLGALGDVLGQAATEEVVAAWTEAYQFLADLLIRREAELYDEARAQPGGWVGWREFVVDRVVPESEVITSFYLRPEDGGQLMAFRPGQYLTLRPELPGHGHLVRNYSVSCAPGRDYYRISVKREDAPEDQPYAPPGMVSTYLHREVAPGATLPVSAPAGDFFLDGSGNGAGERPVVLLSGGVGLTPLMSMLDTLVDRGATRDIWYVHAALSGRHHAFREHLREVSAQHPNVRSYAFYEFPTVDDQVGSDYDRPGRITMDWLRHTVPIQEADFYFCGPRGFMRMLAIGLRALDVPEERIHFEFFGPAQALYA